MSRRAGGVRYEPYQQRRGAVPRHHGRRVQGVHSIDHAGSAIQRRAGRVPRAGARASIARLAVVLSLRAAVRGRRRDAVPIHGAPSRRRLPVARPLFGARLLPADYARTSGIVIRGIGLASLFAFTSWWWQAAGTGRIAAASCPVRDYFAAAHAQLGSERLGVAAVVVLALHRGLDDNCFVRGWNRCFRSARAACLAVDCGVDRIRLLSVARVRRWRVPRVSVGHSAGRVAGRRGRARPSAAESASG